MHSLPANVGSRPRSRTPRLAARWMAVVASLALVALACGRTETSATPGVDGDVIRLGVLSPLQGSQAEAARPLSVGNELFIDYVNEELGGVGGRYRIELVYEDTNNDEATARTKYNKLKDEVAGFVQIYGTPIVTALSPLMAADGVIASPASLDAAWVRNPNLAPVGGPYQIQFANAADYYVNQAGGRGRTICFLGISGRYGDAGLAGITAAGDHLGFELGTVARYNYGDTSFTAQIGQLQGAGCEAVFLTALPTETSIVLGDAAGRGYHPRWIAQSPSWSPDYVDSAVIDELEASLWVVNEGTEWGDRSVPGHADLLDRLARYHPEQGPDYVLTFGYVQAWTMVQVLERAVANGDLSREGIAAALVEPGVLSFDGLTGDYTYGPAAERVAPRASSIFAVNRDKPLGLEKVAVNVETDAARAVVFE